MMLKVLKLDALALSSTRIYLLPIELWAGPSTKLIRVPLLSTRTKSIICGGLVRHGKRTAGFLAWGVARYARFSVQLVRYDGGECDNST
jgi:hypothetical protein